MMYVPRARVMAPGTGWLAVTGVWLSPVTAVRARVHDSRHRSSGRDHLARIRSGNAGEGSGVRKVERRETRHRYAAADHRGSLGSPRRERIARTYRPARRPESRHLACDGPLLLLR